MHRDGPIAYFITWTCYGTWLPGDERGWVKWHQGPQVPQPLLDSWCQDQMVEAAITLDHSQRRLVAQTVRDHVDHRGWTLHAVSCRSNHVHCIVTANQIAGSNIAKQLKTWCTRRLKEQQQVLLGSFEPKELPFKAVRTCWWTEGSSVRHIYDRLEKAVYYVNEAQEMGGSHTNLPGFGPPKKPKPR